MVNLILKMNAQEAMNEIVGGFDEFGNVEDQSDSSEDAIIPDPRDGHTSSSDRELPYLQPQDRSGIIIGKDGEEGW